MSDRTKIVLVVTFLARVLINVHLLRHYTEDERRQMAFFCVSLTLYSSVISRSNSTSLTGHTFPLVLCYCCYRHFRFFSGFWQANVSLTVIEVVLSPLACVWHRITAFICVWMWTNHFKIPSEDGKCTKTQRVWEENLNPSTYHCNSPIVLTFDPVVQCYIHHVLHDGQELSGEQRVLAVAWAVQHPAVPQLHHQTHLPQGEGLQQVPPPQSPHRLRHSRENLS